MTRPLHVLFVGIDGVRWDVVQELPTPALDRVAEAGFCRPVTVNPAGPTISGPSWATMFTGVLATTHGIHDNDFSTSRLDSYPDLITRAAIARPGLRTFAGADWEPLVAQVSGGPLLAGGGAVPVRSADTADGPAAWHDHDQQIADLGVAAIRGYASEGGSLTFVYQHGVDEAGHAAERSRTAFVRAAEPDGTVGARSIGDDYAEMIMGSDRRLGELLDAVDERPTKAAERWLIIVATDHGHRDEGGHGGDTPQERTAWIAAAGEGVPAQPPALLEQADVAGHVLHVLGLTPDLPEFVGLPFGSRTALARPA